MNSAFPPAEELRTKFGKSVRQLPQTVRGVRWMTAGIAFCLAVTLWYAVTVRDKVETWVDVSVQFKGAPADLVISEGLINKLSVRVRAARGLSTSLTGREASMVMDISSITKGSNAIVITRDMLPFTAAYEVMEIAPPRIQVVADTLASREIELEYRIEGKLAPDCFVKTLSLEPQKVTMRGAEALVAGISRIRVPVPLTSAMGQGQHRLSVAVPLTAAISLSPPQVEVAFEVGLRVRRLTLVRDVTVAGNISGQGLESVPGKVTIVADIPESIARDQAALAAITATVLPPRSIAETNRPLPVTVNLPEHAKLISVKPEAVAISVP